MKPILILLLLLPCLAAQNATYHLRDFGQTFRYDLGYAWSLGASPIVLYVVRGAADGAKTLTLEPYEVSVAVGGFDPARGELPAPQFDFKALRASQALELNLVEGVIPTFNTGYAELGKTIVYSNDALAETPRRFIALDNKANTRIVTVDLPSFAVKAGDDLPNGQRNLAIRPAPSAIETEVWVTHVGTGNQISITNLDSGRVEAKIPTNLDLSAESAGIVFSNSGQSAYYAAASGNSGVLLVVDAVTRRVKSTVPLKDAPSKILKSPDGLTLYLLGNGKITYFDVLSGTAELVAAFPVFFGPALIHPNGSRIYTIVGQEITVFDPQSRRIVNRFPVNLGTAVYPQFIQLSQDGTQLFVLTDKGDVGLLDAIGGYLFGSRKIGVNAMNLYAALP